MYRPTDHIFSTCRILRRSSRVGLPIAKHPRPKSTSSAPADSIDDYYSLLLSQPLSHTSSATRTSPTPRQPPPTNSKDANIAKARVVFGSRLVGPARRRDIESQSTNIAGILVPPRPQEPDNCCMSGCVNCVWDFYRDDVEEWATKSREARMKQVQMRGSEGSGSMDDDGGGTETNWAHAEDRDLFADVPVGIREFMRTEKLLKERHMKERTVGD
ncbi:hypothetical protein MMC26_000694 [Xylographa opegraphella]|nr:hypothetical protein [Xylographa opegraphella]